MVSSSVNVSHRLALFRIHLTVCRATGQFNAPTLSHAQFDAPFNAQVTPTVAIPTVTAHTHSCCTIQHTAHHSNHCCTNTAPYSTPLVTQTYAAPNTTGPTAAAPTTVAPTTAALAMLHHTLCVAPSKHILLLTFLLFPQIIHSLAFLFFSPI